MSIRLLYVALLSLFTILLGNNPTAPVEYKYIASPYHVSISTPPCVKLYYTIKKYARQYDIPLNYAFGIAYVESGYKGPEDWSYKSKGIVSSAGALGPMQIMPATAHLLFPNDTITNKMLRDSMELNVECSMKLLKKTHDLYGDWGYTFGCYNTGQKVINPYAVIVENFSRKKNWTTPM